MSVYFQQNKIQEAEGTEMNTSSYYRVITVCWSLKVKHNFSNIFSVFKAHQIFAAGVSDFQTALVGFDI